MAKRARCASFRCIDVRALRRRNFLRSTPSALLWSSDGAVYDVLLIAKLHVLRVFHAVLVGGVENFATQTIPIHWAKCHFGGERPWFNCPCESEGKSCGRRVAMLFWVDGCLACRRCLGVPYESQQENAGVRAVRRAEKIKARLGGTAAEPFRIKPRGMHWRTYRRLCEQAEHAEAAADRWLLESFAGTANDSAPTPQQGDNRRPK
jgi:hypothetical protein